MLSSISKKEVLEQAIDYWNPEKTKKWQNDEMDLVIGKREGYYIYDMDGKELMDVHLNGGTYNLGHRNSEIVSTLKEALDEFDIGNHHFPAIARSQLAKMLYDNTPDNLVYTIFSSAGGEAVDVAIKSARYATGRTKVVSIENGYHGTTGLSLPLGHERYSKPFLSEGDPEEFIHVPFNDLTAMEEALKNEDIAAVILETIPATYGFPIPEENYLKEIKRLCEKYGSLYIADEVQTGLMRTGALWGFEKFGIKPDILVTAKGLGGGIYPIGATVVNEKAGYWLKENGTIHVSTFGGSELGCIVAMKVLEISQREEVVKNVEFISEYLRAGLDSIKQQNKFFTDIRQIGVVMGLEFNHPEGAKYVMRSLYKHGVWARYSTLDPRILQFKPGLLCDREYCDELLLRMEKGIQEASEVVASS